MSALQGNRMALELCMGSGYVLQLTWAPENSSTPYLLLQISPSHHLHCKRGTIRSMQAFLLEHCRV